MGSFTSQIVAWRAKPEGFFMPPSYYWRAVASHLERNPTERHRQ
jgi:hypothetical protein